MKSFRELLVEASDSKLQDALNKFASDLKKKHLAFQKRVDTLLAKEAKNLDFVFNGKVVSKFKIIRPLFAGNDIKFTISAILTAKIKDDQAAVVKTMVKELNKKNAYASIFVGDNNINFEINLKRSI